MKQMATCNKSSAPALSRGLEIIKALESSVPLTLEQIANQLKIPKASTLRLLETMDQMGIVQKGPDKHYTALQKLCPINTSRDVFRASLESKMIQLMMATHCTVEWYEPCPDGMQLILQKNPETELCVKARPGFLRGWATELEAVARLGHAFANEAIVPNKSQQYAENGILKSIDKQEIQRLIQTAKSEQTAHDTAYNDNGVRRFAIAAFEPSSNNFMGVLAVAETYHFSRKANPNDILQLLKTTLA
jgi:DNA-binding IclR family transcriptional regulator